MPSHLFDPGPLVGVRGSDCINGPAMTESLISCSHFKNKVWDVFCFEFLVP